VASSRCTAAPRPPDAGGRSPGQAGERDAALSWLGRAADAALRIAGADDRELVATDLRDVRRLL
jgi:hypothetical protein